MKINNNFLKLGNKYLFAGISARIKEFEEKNPDRELISLGIGDVTLPICSAAVEAAKKAAEEMGLAQSFRGYGPSEGYEFLREKIKLDYAEFGIELKIDEIFVSNGAKSDVGDIGDIFSNENTCIIPEPSYPVYVDSTVISGRNIVYVSANEGNSFLPMPDEIPKWVTADMIYLCSPNNPVGTVYSKEQLKVWVDFANRNGSVILFDGAYKSFISDKSLPISIFQIEGSRTCAIEFRSFSKTAGFTGMRCAYAVVPHELIRGGASLNMLWYRRQCTKFNGVSYIIQRAAEAVFSCSGKEQIAKSIEYYKKNSKIIQTMLKNSRIKFFGGENSPYIWMKCPNGMDSWEFFDFLLGKCAVVGVPGLGFGPSGNGWFRLTCFNSNKKTKEAVERISTILETYVC
jgi:LL-diaminopimelate aminotransferase